MFTEGEFRLYSQSLRVKSEAADRRSPPAVAVVARTGGQCRQLQLFCLGEIRNSNSVPPVRLCLSAVGCPLVSILIVGLSYGARNVLSYTLDVMRWGGKRLKGCIFSPPSLLPVPGRGKEARKHNLSIASNPVSVSHMSYQCSAWIFTFHSPDIILIKYTWNLDTL